MNSVISPEMNDAIGREISRTVSYPVSASDIRRWAIAAYWPADPPARFLSDSSDLIAPEDLNPFAWAVASRHLAVESVKVDMIDPDATEKQLGIVGPGLTHQLNGGLSMEYSSPMKAGDVITSVRVLSGYKTREGKLGTMLFTTTTDTWTNQRDEIVKRTDMTLIRY